MTRSIIFTLVAITLTGMAVCPGEGAIHAERVYLSGRGPSDAVEWDFHCSSGRQSGEWTRIPVPSNWEQHGFGGYDYGHVPSEEKHDEVGTYRTTFMVPEEWKDCHVRLVFEGSMTETSIKVNGIPVGAPNLGGYLPFRFQLDGNTFRPGQRPEVLKYGELNELEVTVAKKPSNLSVDLAERRSDYWVFGGIYRPVYLEVLPQDFIHRVAIDAKSDGRFRMEAFLQHHDDIRSRALTSLSLVDSVEAQVLALDGTPVGQSFTASIPGPVSRACLETQVENPAQWTPESPNLYQVRTRLMKAGEIVHERFDTFGFRTLELRPGNGLFLNGTRLLIKGVNRNAMHADTARAIDPEEAWNDARLIKAMNANLVRSHLPPTTAFMDACDQLGLLVISELCNWQRPAIDTPVARNLAYELVITYHNHPSCILWANGNEGGFNKEIDELYPLFDLQDRPVIHPWAVFDGLDTLHYPNYGQFAAAMSRSMVVLPTEFLHGLYDGGHGAGLADYWGLVRQSPLAAGGVLWCWADAGVARTDLNGWIDTGGNWSADGIVGPRRELEASYFSIREIWSPIQIPVETIPADFDGNLSVENHYLFTSLDGCRLDWQLERSPTATESDAQLAVVSMGSLYLPSLAPGGRGTVKLPIPGDWRSSDILKVRATDPAGAELMQWSWPLRNDAGRTQRSEASSIESVDDGEFQVGAVRWSFDPSTGRLNACSVDGLDIGLGNGPVLYAGTANGVVKTEQSWTVETVRQPDTVVITATNPFDGSTFSWQLFADGRALLDYSFAPLPDPLTYCAVGFELPESSVAAKRWLGDGPYRIWANRRQGPQFGLWENAYNDTIPGVKWDYPAFKGVFSNVDWMFLHLRAGASLLIEPAGLADVGVLQPSNVMAGGADAGPNIGPINAVWDFPEDGGLFLFHKVPAIGTKFLKAASLGPQSEPESVSGPIAGRVTFSLVSP